MTTKQYDRAAFIRAYIDANRPSYIHEDFKTYYTGLFDALQRAFGITLSHEGVRNNEVYALWMLFHAAARSYQSMRTPRSYFLEDSLINSTLDRLGERGEPVTKLEEAIQRLTTANEEAHLQLLNELFVLLWGPVDTVVTSEDLLAIGFDDAKEPQVSDYFEYM